jgi:hypothetical protein
MKKVAIAALFLFLAAIVFFVGVKPAQAQSTDPAVATVTATDTATTDQVAITDAEKLKIENVRKDFIIGQQQYQLLQSQFETLRKSLLETRQTYLKTVQEVKLAHNLPAAYSYDPNAGVFLKTGTGAPDTTMKAAAPPKAAISASAKATPPRAKK